MTKGAVVLCLLLGCAGAPTSPRATLVTPAAAIEVDDRESKKVRYRFDDEASRIDVIGSGVSGSLRIVVHEFSGEIVQDGEGLLVRLDADMRSLEAEDEDFDEFIKSPDYLDVERLPDMRFRSTRPSRPDGDGGELFEGNLLLHGVSKTIAFPARVQLDGDVLRLDTEFVIDRRDFEIRASSLLDMLIHDDMTIQVSLVGESDATDPSPSRE